MSATETGLTALERNWAMVDRSLEDLDDGIIAARPNEDSNSIGWLLWHMNRVVDRFVHTWCQDAQQVWAKGGWHAKFGLSDDVNETGAGWTKEQVAAWRLPAKDSLVGYYEEVKAAARSLAGNPDSPQAVVFSTSIIDELVSIETYYVHYHVISDWNTSVLRSAKPGKWLSGQTSREYLGGLSAAGFERPLEIPPRPPGTVGSFLGTLVFDNCVHGGQIAYLRGFYRGMGWFVYHLHGDHRPWSRR